MENPAAFQTGGWRAALPFGGREKGLEWFL